MIENELCEMIVERYYDDIYNFCYSYLKNTQAAEDCTQETFLLFISKKSKLYLSDRIRLWLYKAARKIIKKYIRNNSLAIVSYDDMSEEIADKTDFFNKDLIEEIYAILKKDEADLIVRYFNSDYGDRKRLADEYGITIAALYNKIDRVRKKLASELNRSETYLK